LHFGKIFKNIWVYKRVRAGEKKIVYRVFIWKPEGKGLIGRLSCKWENNNKVDLKGIGWRHLRIVQSGLFF
jgi:hypothetical protein